MPTIRTAADRILATVAAFGHLKEGNFGPYQSVLFESPSLPDGKVWRSMKPEEAKTFAKGQQAYLVPTTNKQGKPSWDIELLPTDQAQTATTATTAAPQGTIPNDKKPIVAAYATDLAKLYSYCYSQAVASMPESAPMEAIQACASSVFIATTRKHSI